METENNHIFYEMVKMPLIPRPDNFTPPNRTPWGGRRIVELKAKSGLISGVKGDIVGESWEISGHPSFPNRFIIHQAGENIEVTIETLGRLVPEQLYGKANLDHYGPNMPFLVKLLNSGKNLSVQVHPPVGYKEGVPSKTEAWFVLEAEEGAGIYIGLKDSVTEGETRRALESGEDITTYLNFVEVGPGDTFFIPAGTPHAIGAGLLLLEPQETSEATYRLYDYDRLDSEGRPRRLHIDDALASINWDAPRGQKFVEQVRRYPKLIGGFKDGLARVERLVEEKEFVLRRITLGSGDVYRGDSSKGLHGLTVTHGAAAIHPDSGSEFATIRAVGSAIIPAAMGRYMLMGKDKHSVILQTTSSVGPA